MGDRKWAARFVTALGLALLVSAQAQAQGANALGDPMRGTPGLGVEMGQGGRASQQRNDAARVRDEDPMGPAGIGFKLGMAFAPNVKLSSPLRDELGPIADEIGLGETGNRAGLLLALPITLGDGDGIGFDLEPFLFRYGRQVDAAVQVSSHVLEYGGYLGPAYRFHVRRVYLSLGIGAKFGWINDDLLDFGLDLQGRVPLSVTHYVTDGLGLTFELGLAYGATAVKFDEMAIDNELIRSFGGSSSAVTTASEVASVQTGRGFGLDATIGVRFP